MFDNCKFNFFNGYDYMQASAATDTGTVTRGQTGRFGLPRATFIGSSTSNIRFSPTNFASSTSGFSIGFWWYESSGTPAYPTPFNISTGYSYMTSQCHIEGRTSVDSIFFVTGGTSRAIAHTRAQGQWNHWFITRTADGTWSLYYNTNLVGTTYSDTTSITSQYIQVGGDGTYGCNGYIDDMTYWNGEVISPVYHYMLTSKKYLFPIRRGERRYE